MKEGWEGRSQSYLVHQETGVVEDPTYMVYGICCLLTAVRWGADCTTLGANMNRFAGWIQWLFTFPADCNPSQVIWTNVLCTAG